MTTHQHLARRPLGATVVPSAYATTPGVHWRRTTVPVPAAVDLDLSQVAGAPARPAAQGRASAPSKLPAADGLRSLMGARAEANQGPAASTGKSDGVTPQLGALRDGLTAALDRCDQASSSGSLIHLRMDALPRWLDLAHAQDPAPAEQAAASYGGAGTAANHATHETAQDLLDVLSQRLLGALPAQSVVEIDASGQAWIVIQPVSSSAAAVGWARYLMQLLSTGVHRRAPTPAHAVAGGPQAVVKSLELPLEVSAGLCLFPADADQVDQLLAAAGTASAQARSLGIGQCQAYSRDMTTRSRNALNEGRALSAALGSGGLEISLQGRAELRSRALCVAQVQLSWPRRIGDRSDGAAKAQPTSGASGAPSGNERRVAKRDPCGLVGLSLEALARQHGLAEALGHEMLGRTCAQLRRWRDDGFAVPQLSLRLPAELLARADFAIELLDLLGRHRLPGSCLALELGQDSLAALSDDTAHLLDSAGVTLIADAARIDLVSLTACQHLRVSALVVDLADLGDITISRGPARTTLLALAGLAHGMAMRLTARSVDHQAELDVLSGTGCDDYQGAVLARPLPARIWSRLLAEPGAGARAKRAFQPAASAHAELATAM